MGWAVGEVVVLEEVWRGRVWSARPTLLVEDAPDHLVLWLPRGVAWKTATDASGVARLPTRAERFSRRLRTLEWVLGDFIWDLDTLWVLPDRRAHAVSFGWGPGGEFVGWYVNLQETTTRGDFRVQTMDLMLDLVIAPSGEARWKDDDEVQRLLDDGVYDERLVAALRSEGEGVLTDFREWRFPFDRGLESWRPDPRWGVPELPPQWSPNR